MKSGLAALVIAMIELKEAKLPIKGTIRLLATAGEEVGQRGAEILAKEGYMKNVAALIIGEPSGYRIAYANKGELDITLTSKGKAAHSSMPKLGNNAVAHLLAILNRLQAQIQQATANLTSPDLGETIFNVDVIHGGDQVNAIPALATAKINIRTIPEFANTKILQIFKDTIAAYNENTNGHIEMNLEMQTSPILGDPEADLVKIAQKVGRPYLQATNYSAETLNDMQAAAKATGIAFSPTEIVTVGVSGATDAGKLLADQPQGATYLVFGPGNETAHQDNEYVSQQMYLNFIEIYQKMLLTYFNHS
jgi:succinyl-diaminopimelate desuccinylase